MGLRIGIDARSLTRGIGGICRYLENMVCALAEEVSGHDYYLLAHRPIPEEKAPHGMRTNVLESRFGTGWLMWHVPQMVKQLNLDVVWFPEQIVPKRCPGIKYVATIHDLIPLVLPDVHALREKIIFRLLSKTLGRADMVVADSENTRSDVLRLIKGVRTDAVRVVSAGISGDYRPHDPKCAREAITQRRGISRPYILFVGTFEPRKNIPCVVRAFELLRRRGVDLDLCLVGQRGWKYSPILREIERSPCREGIHCFHDVNSEELPELYSGAECFVFPSFYEGFGLPPLEAMACGTPVVVSNNSSLTEIVGDVGLYCNPTSPETIADAVNQIVKDPSLRALLVRQGIERARRFSWKTSAVQMSAIFEEVMHG